MPKTSITIGNAGGYWGDDLQAMRRQLEGGPLDYITMDFLAEITMSILQKQRARKPELGYATDFVTQIRDCLPLIIERGTTVISNAGGINPLGLGLEIHELVKAAGHDLKVGVVRGDDILTDLDNLTAAGESFTNMETGEAFSPIRHRISSANVYFGAEPVVRALEAGCRIIVTGRVTDTGVTLAPMIHEFGWAADDWNRIAAGVVAGHIIECGTQASGGNITDWEDVKSFHRIGYPMLKVSSDGSFVVTKHPKTGGLVSEKTIKEQLVYEMGDPSNYISPDGIACFDTLQLDEVGPNRVRVSGVTGKPAPTHLKVSMSYDDGWKASGSLLMSGPHVEVKAKTMADIFWKRLGLTFEDQRTEAIGIGSIWPAELSEYEPSEILLRFGVRDQDADKITEFGKLLPSLILSGPSGVAVTGGRPRPAPVVAYWPTLIARERCQAEVIVIDPDGTQRNETMPLGRSDVAPPDGSKTKRAKRLNVSHGKRTRSAPLRAIAYARSGDKGDTCNIGVLARSPEAYAWLCDNLKPTVVKRFFKGITRGRVTRYELDNLLALNFLLEQTLGGGGTRSLMIDPQGKTLSQALLEMRLEIPVTLLKA